jgi:pyruvate dehydrogenase E2 component (dihydrolipoamide acetyltransferase)
MSQVEIKVPDIGDFKEVEVIELLVKPGDTVKAEQSLITVESDKASMEIPSSHAGVVKELKVKIGDKIAEGSLILILEADASAAAAAPAPARGPMPPPPPPLRSVAAARCRATTSLLGSAGADAAPRRPGPGVRIGEPSGGMPGAER